MAEEAVAQTDADLLSPTDLQTSAGAAHNYFTALSPAAKSIVRLTAVPDDAGQGVIVPSALHAVIVSAREDLFDRERAA